MTVSSPSSVESVQQYLLALIPTALSVPAAALERAFEASAASNPELDALAAFANEEQQLVLYIAKSRTGAVSLCPEVTYSHGGSGAVLIKKDHGALKASRLVAEQVQFAVLCGPRAEPIADPTDQAAAATTAADAGEDADSTTTAAKTANATEGSGSRNVGTDVLSSMYSFVQLGFNPLLRSFAANKQPTAEDTVTTAGDDAGTTTTTATNNASEAAEPEARELPESLRMALPLISKRMNELGFAMRSCLETLEVPEVTLVIDPVVAEAVAKQQAMGGRPDATLEELGLGEDVRDATMLNRLQVSLAFVKEKIS